MAQKRPGRGGGKDPRKNRPKRLPRTPSDIRRPLSLAGPNPDIIRNMVAVHGFEHLLKGTSLKAAIRDANEHVARAEASIGKMAAVMKREGGLQTQDPVYRLLQHNVETARMRLRGLQGLERTLTTPNGSETFFRKNLGPFLVEKQRQDTHAAGSGLTHYSAADEVNSFLSNHNGKPTEDQIDKEAYAHTREYGYLLALREMAVRFKLRVPRTALIHLERCIETEQNIALGIEKISDMFPAEIEQRLAAARKKRGRFDE